MVVLDNSESADEVARLRALAAGDPRVTVVVTPRNLGYYGAAQWWVEREPMTATWRAVCNTDVWLSTDCFLRRLSQLQSPPEIVAPDIVALPGRRAQNPFMVRRPSARRMLLRRLALSHRGSAWLARRIALGQQYLRRRDDTKTSQEIYAPHGSFILFHREFFERGGSLRHPPFLFGEEITVAERARELGQRVGFRPDLTVAHLEHQATGKRPAAMFRAQREAAAYAHRLVAHQLMSSPARRHARVPGRYRRHVRTPGVDR
jgi:GT2 family glycosyltransferase